MSLVMDVPSNNNASNNAIFLSKTKISSVENISNKNHKILPNLLISSVKTHANIGSISMSSIIRSKHRSCGACGH